MLRVLVLRAVLLCLVPLVLLGPGLLVLWGVVCWVGCCLGFRWRGF